MEKAFENYEIISHLKNTPLYSNIVDLYTHSKNILSEIPKTFSNYTLHDINHSIRVIGYMNELIKRDLDKYSDLHLALIVYVGLLHDIGMFVSDKEQLELYEMFKRKSDDFDLLSENEKNKHLQEYVRKHHGIRVEPLLEEEINSDTKLKSFLYIGETKSYDLSKIVSEICQSHNESCDWIITNLSDEMHYADYVINPQQIAILLRIGDALDIDDRRAPYGLYNILNPQGKSDNEWKKHIPITNYDKIQYNNDHYEITFSGECNEPYVYRNIIEYIDWINKDFNEANSILDNKKDYSLNLKLPINVNIKTIGFVSTSLRFNLEYKQVAELLMGEKIYGSKKDGLRELIQNAIDAVLVMDNIENNNHYSSYKPMIVVDIKEKENKIIIFDNGIGMSESILKKYFFNIGNSYYVSDEFNDEYYTYKPIGKFGIGFLSCFMLSSNVELETKHYKESDIIRMSFDRNSPYITKYDSKGTNHFEHGTKIILDYDSIIPSIFKDTEEIVNYLSELLLVNKYELKIIDNGKTIELPINALKSNYTKNNSIYEFDYKLSSRANIVLNLFDYFKNDENVYIVDEKFYPKYINLGFFEEWILDFERELQNNNIDLQRDDLYEETSLPQFLYELINNNLNQINKYYNDNKEIFGFFIKYLHDYIEENELILYQVPVLLNKNIFNSFLNVYENNGLDRALHEYKGDAHLITILCNKDVFSANVLLEIIEEYLLVNGDGYETPDIDYFEEYPIKPILKKINVLKSLKSNKYIVVDNNTEIPSKVYLKGIKVIEDNLTVPYSISGIDIDNCWINIISDNYFTDVSRNSFESNSLKKIINIIITLIYNNMLETNYFDNDEKELVKLFLNEYYVDNDDN